MDAGCWMYFACWPIDTKIMRGTVGCEPRFLLCLARVVVSRRRAGVVFVLCRGPVGGVTERGQHHPPTELCARSGNQRAVALAPTAKHRTYDDTIALV